MQKSDVCWLIEEYILDENLRLLEEVEKQGYKVKILPHDYKFDAIKDFNTFTDYFLSIFPQGSTVVFQGSLQTAKQIYYQISTYGYWTTLTKTDFDNLYCSKYLRYIQPRFQLNEYHLYLPQYDLFRLKRDKDVFIRPDDPYKSFVGQVLPTDTSISDFRIKNDLLGSDGTDFILVSDVNNFIQYEFRCFCTKDQIVSASYYKHQELFPDNPIHYQQCADNDLGLYFVQQNILPGLEPLIEQIGMIVVDVAFIRSGYNSAFKVIELGHPMTCSLYDANFERYVDSMSAVMYDKYLKEQEENV